MLASGNKPIKINFCRLYFLHPIAKQN